MKTERKKKARTKQRRKPLREAAVSKMLGSAIGLHRQGRMDEAEVIYRDILRQVPDQADALHYLGLLNYQRGHVDKALEMMRRAVLIAPGYADAHNNLGNVLKKLGRSAEAETQYRQAIALNPRHVDAFNNLGAVLRTGKRYVEAIGAFEKAVALSPDFADAWHSLGNALKADGQIEKALSAYHKAIEIRPGHGDAYVSLGQALYRYGRIDEAATVYSKWLATDPDNPVAKHMLAACSGQEIPARAGDEYVRRTFDGFAASFDASLKRLEYRAPQLVGEELHRLMPTPAREYAVLDAGCGTGLCGALLRPYARHLLGVDLSTAMLAKAEALNVYDQLLAAELTGYLQHCHARYDLIVSADTLCYFGDLKAVLAAARRALLPGGRLVFTLEQAPASASDPGYRLNPHGRYSHDPGYLEQVIAGAGLGPATVRKVVLRQEAGEPVAGLLVATGTPAQQSGKSAKL